MKFVHNCISIILVISLEEMQYASKNCQNEELKEGCTNTNTVALYNIGTMKKKLKNLYFNETYNLNKLINKYNIKLQLTIQHQQKTN